MPLLIRNLSQIATPQGSTAVRGAAMRELRVVERGAVVMEGESFLFAGPERELPAGLARRISEEVDGSGKTAIPGFVDSHTHLPFAGTRESEFNRRLQGETYEDIARSGGGILSSVAATRRAGDQELHDLLVSRTWTMSRHGTTTAEAKSGYGLNLQDELKQLRALRSVSASSPVRLLSTCLAAHDFPPEARGSERQRTEFVQLICEEILPRVAAEGLAVFCDAFVERGAFSPEQGRAVLESGRALGLIPRLHADEFSDLDGAALAAVLGCASADHLMHISEKGIRALAASDTVANVLPATSFFLMSSRYAPARALIEAGAAVALSTDCNPGSSMTESMQMVVQLACLQMKLTVEEALTAATLNGAFSLREAERTGSIEPGKRADLVLLEAPNYLHLVYHFGVNLITDVWSGGRPVIRQSRAVAPQLPAGAHP